MARPMNGRRSPATSFPPAGSTRLRQKSRPSIRRRTCPAMARRISTTMRNCSRHGTTTTSGSASWTTPSAIAAAFRSATARLRGRTTPSSCGATIRPSRATSIRRRASPATGAPTGPIPSARRSCSICAAAWRDMKASRVTPSAPVTIRLSSGSPRALTKQFSN